MITFLINAIKIIFLLGFLVLIHEGGHFLVAKLCKVKVNEFAIGFGPTIWKKQGKITKYAVRLIPLGGFVSMEGEEEHSEEEGSFSKASIPKRIAIVLAGGLVNILFGTIVYWILASIVLGNLGLGFKSLINFLLGMVESLKMIFTGKVFADQLMGPIGISTVIAGTTGMQDFVYLLSLISVSLGVTNLLPVLPLDGGKVIILIIEAIRRKPLKEKFEIGLQMAGFIFFIGLSIYVAYNDILRIV
ncbi:MAG: site-2 protease family protein [Clostridia bacterium]|nr:site-2 protease family protein [Clostridia bacterium]